MDDRVGYRPEGDQTMKKRQRTSSMEMEEILEDLPTDVLLEILRCLPSSSRRRARLVCRLWRDLITNCTTEMHGRPKPLLWNTKRAVAYLVDDLSPSSTGSCTELWRSAGGRHNLQLVGTCNGLLCLCNNRERLGGAITLVNPTTGEMLPLPPLQGTTTLLSTNNRSMQSWGDAYSFAYHPITGRYKVVHVSCSYGEALKFDAVHVLTVGETTWREVLAGPAGTRCHLAAGVLSIDGVTYWVKVTGDDEVAKIVSFDLEKEQVTSISMPLPPLPQGCGTHLLAEVHGRLGVVTGPEVWVLEEGWRWSCWFRFQQCRIPRRHFVYGECVLTRKGPSLYGHRIKGKPMSGWRLTCDDEVRVGHMDEGTTLVAKITDEHFIGDYQAFAYVETNEPLGVYVTN